MARGVIYGLFDHKGLRYIGQTTQNIELRLKQHLWYSSKSKNHLGAWLRSLNSIPTMEVIEECVYDKLNERELFYINRFQLLGCSLTNSMTGCELSGHHTHSEETKKKIGEATVKTHTGMKRSKKVKDNISKAMTKDFYVCDVRTKSITKMSKSEYANMVGIKESSVLQRINKNKFYGKVHREYYLLAYSKSELKVLLKQLGI